MLKMKRMVVDCVLFCVVWGCGWVFLFLCVWGGVGGGRGGGGGAGGGQASFTMGQAERFHTTCPDSPPCFLLIIFNNKNTTYSVVYRLLSSCDIA